MLASLQAIVAPSAAKIDDRDKEWPRNREEDKATAATQQTQIATCLEEQLGQKMVAVKRHVSFANTTAIINEGCCRRRQTSPTVSSSVCLDTRTQKDDQEERIEPTVQDSSHQAGEETPFAA